MFNDPASMAIIQVLRFCRRSASPADTIDPRWGSCGSIATWRSQRARSVLYPLKQSRLLAREARLTAVLAGNAKTFRCHRNSPRQERRSYRLCDHGRRASGARGGKRPGAFGNLGLEQHPVALPAEIESLRGQMEALTQEEGTIQTQLKGFSRAFGEGLAHANTLQSGTGAGTDRQREDKHSNCNRSEPMRISRWREQRLNERSNERSREDARDLQQTKDEISEVRARIRTAGDLLTGANHCAGRSS